MTQAQQRKRINMILDKLSSAYPDARVGLDFENPLQLLVATMLSAQCTDERVNIVTKSLFKKYHSVRDYINVPQEELENDIRSTGFFRNKARNIKACCEVLLSKHNSEVPATMDELVQLPGVGRKTANCVLSNCYNIPGLTVDTHVIRISNLLGLVEDSDAVRIEFALMDVVEKERWNEFDLLIITHGRRTCIARRPKCAECVISDLCPSAQL